MDLEGFKQKLRGYKKEEIIFTSHAEIQALMRQIRKVIIVTIININRNWQKIIEGKK